MNRIARVCCLLCVAMLSYWFACLLAQPRSTGGFQWKVEKRLAKPASDRERETAALKVNQVWDRIETKLAEVEPVILKSLCEPASDHDIKVFRDRLGIDLPADLEASLRRHNGTTTFFGVFWMHSTSTMVRTCAEEAQQSIDDWPATHWAFLFQHDVGRWEPGALVVGRNDFAMLVDTEEGGITLLQCGNNYSSPHHDSFLGSLEYLADALEAGKFEISDYRQRKHFRIEGWGCDHY